MHYFQDYFISRITLSDHMIYFDYIPKIKTTYNYTVIT